MINRRRLLAGAMLLPFTRIGTAEARVGCQPTPMGVRCRAEVNFPSVAAKYDPQFQSQWCWAACISMLFKFYGHPVSQERIVREAYGAPVNLPAGAGFVIAQQLNRRWTDDRGKEFSSTLRAAFDADARVAAITDAQIIQALQSENPLIAGVRSHAVLLTLVDFMQTPMGPSVIGAGAFDPWPSVGPRRFAMDELVPVFRGGSLRFLAQAKVESL